MSTPHRTARRSDFDFLRVMAMVAVVAIHCVMPIIMLKLPNDDNWIGADIVDNYLRWCVPVFIMLSGALLIRPQTFSRMKEFYRRRAVRVLVPLIAWSALYGLWTIIVLGGNVPLGTFLEAFAAGSPVGGPHLYFLFIILGLYALAPVISLYAGSVSPAAFRRTSLALLAVASAWLLIQVQVLGRADDYTMLTWALPFVGYFMLGHSLADTRTTKRQNILLLLGFFAFGLFNVVASVYTRYDDNMFYQNYISPTIIGLSICAFLGGRALYGKLRTAWLDRTLAWLAQISLAVYLVHVMILETLAHYLAFDRGSIVVAGPVFIVVLLLSIAAATVMRYMPGIRRLAG